MWVMVPGLVGLAFFFSLLIVFKMGLEAGCQHHEWEISQEWCKHCGRKESRQVSHATWAKD